MAQSVARQAVNLQVAGSNPAGGDFEMLPLLTNPSQKSAVVQWLGYLAFTQETRVQTPAAESCFPRHPVGQWESGALAQLVRAYAQ